MPSIRATAARGAMAIMLAVASAEPAAAQQVRAGLLTCDVSAGLGLIITSQKQLSCAFVPDRPDLMREDYDGSITKFGLDLGIVGGGVMVWALFTGTVAGPGFLADNYVGASGEASLGAGLGANVLVGESNRTVTLQVRRSGSTSRLESLLFWGFRAVDRWARSGLRRISALEPIAIG
jgi:hypothetical protein